MDIWIVILLAIVMCIYFILGYLFFVTNDIKQKRFRELYRAVHSVYQQSKYSKYALDQLTMIYNKMPQEFAKGNTTLLDMLETLLYYYDTQSDNRFQSMFGLEKDARIRSCIYEIICLIKEEDPFTSNSPKEANYLKDIQIALQKGNADLGHTVVKRLSEELIIKDKLLQKKEKENQLTTMLSVIGILLTIIFGVISMG